MPKNRKPGTVREFIPKSNRMSYKSHGMWVRSKRTGNIGKIGYYDRKTKLVAVVWEPATKAESNWPTKTYSASLCKPSELVKLLGYAPEPWYDFKEVKRREKSLDGD